MITQVVKFIDSSGETADMRLGVFSKGVCKIHRAVSSSGGASLGTVCVAGNVTQNASDTWQHCEPPPDE